MAGGTLIISREVNNHLHYKKRFTSLGFKEPALTALDRDGLNSFIHDMQPELIIMGARFYQCSTPYLMGELKKLFPHINMAAVSIGEYPPDLAMSFIINGVKSYVTSFDGVDQFYKGLDLIAKGRKYISPEVKKRIDLRRDLPDPASTLTDHQKQIILMVCNGFYDKDIAEILYITRRTVTTHKSELYKTLNIRNSNELIRAALELGIVKREGMYFYPYNFELSPMTEEQINKRRA